MSGACILADISALIFHPAASSWCAGSVGMAMVLPGEPIFIAPIAAVAQLVELAGSVAIPYFSCAGRGAPIPEPMKLQIGSEAAACLISLGYKPLDHGRVSGL